MYRTLFSQDKCPSGLEAKLAETAAESDAGLEQDRQPDRPDVRRPAIPAAAFPEGESHPGAAAKRVCPFREGTFDLEPRYGSRTELGTSVRRRSTAARPGGVAVVCFMRQIADASFLPCFSHFPRLPFVKSCVEKEALPAKVSQAQARKITFSLLLLPAIRTQRNSSHGLASN